MTELIYLSVRDSRGSHHSGRDKLADLSAWGLLGKNGPILVAFGDKAVSPRMLPTAQLSPGAGLCRREQGQHFGVVTSVGVCRSRAPAR